MLSWGVVVGREGNMAEVSIEMKHPVTLQDLVWDTLEKPSHSWKGKSAT